MLIVETMNSYDEIPVKFCKHCLYLGNVKVTNLFDQQVEYCPHCGSTEFEETTIDEWDKLFEEKYKQGKFLKLKKSWRTIMEESR